MSVEFFNYAMALFVYCGRYASVFWETNKCFATLFSVQLFSNAIQCLCLYLFTCVLYKVKNPSFFPCFFFFCWGVCRI